MGQRQRQKPTQKPFKVFKTKERKTCINQNAVVQEMTFVSKIQKIEFH
jgi:hypothetical protein